MCNHNWVELRVVPLSIDVIDDKAHFFASEEAIEIAEEDMMICCYDCKMEPSAETLDTDCTGAPTREELIEK